MSRACEFFVAGGGSAVCTSHNGAFSAFGVNREARRPRTAFKVLFIRCVVVK